MREERQVAQPQHIDMSAVAELTAKHVKKELKWQQVFEELSSFSEQLIDMNQRVQKFETSQTSQLEALRASFLGEVCRADRNAASARLGSKNQEAALICKQHQQETELGDVQFGSITPPHVAAIDHTLDEESEGVPRTVSQAENMVAMDLDEEGCEKLPHLIVAESQGARPTVLNIASLHRKDYYTFGESIWNLSLFVGVPQLGVATSAFVMILLCTQIFAQLILICIINESFTAPTIDDKTAEDMYKWRVYSGHAYSLVDLVSFEPLARRICNHDGSIPYSDGVHNVLDLITEYLPWESDYDDSSPKIGHLIPYTNHIGIILCVLCIAVWLMNIIASFNKQWQLVHALKDLQHAGGDCISLDLDNTMTLRALSTPRKIWCVVLITMQLVVEIFLGLMGVLYMIFTISLRDLLLNCSALLIVLDLDGVFYTALAPREAKIFMSVLNPLARPLPKTVKGLNWEVVLAMPCLIVACVCSYVELRNQADTLEATRNNICGGNRDFVALRTAAGVVMAGEPVQKAGVTDTYMYRAISQLIREKAMAKTGLQLGSLSGTTWDGMFGSVWSLDHYSGLDRSQAVAYYNPLCRDLLPVTVHPISRVALLTIHDASHNKSIRACNHLRSFCSQDSVLGTRSRQYCPTTCGCDDVTSGLVLSGDTGCPPSCTRSSNYINSTMKACVDEGNHSAYFRRYIDGLRAMQTSYPGHWVRDFDVSIRLIQEHGCELIPKKIPLSFNYAVWTDLCVDSGASIISLAFACPVSCGCHQQYKVGCPPSCMGVR